MSQTIAEASPSDRPAPRSRILSAALLATTVALGLASRRYASALPSSIATYAGDALWAAMVFWIASLFFPRAGTRTLAIAALAISFSVELSQLYHAPWIDSLRNTRLGALALGHGFLWSDLLCYAAGVAAALLIDKGLLSLAKPRSRNGRAKKAEDENR
jgi:hypothetical protein